MIRSIASTELSRTCAAATIAFELLALAAPAAAQSPPAPADTPRRLERRWYGWQTLATDGAAITLLAGTALLTDGAPPGPLPTTGYVLGTLSYAFGGPIVHFAHGNPGWGFASFGLRVPAPVITSLGAMGVYCGLQPGEYCGLIGVPFAGAAILAAIAIDAAVFAYDDVPVESVGDTPFRILPIASVTRRGASLGLVLTH
jgi:hypothetical protein